MGSGRHFLLPRFTTVENQTYEGLTGLHQDLALRFEHPDLAGLGHDEEGEGASPVMLDEFVEPELVG